MAKHVALLAAVIALLVAGLAALFLNVSFLPSLASEQGKHIDITIQLLFSIAAGILALIVVVLLYSVVLFRQRPGDTADGPPIQSNSWLLGAFFFVPLGLVLWSATFGAIKLRDIERAPAPQAQELEVRVTSFQWGWLFRYPELGITTAEVRLPEGRPVLFRLTSDDVLHSLWVPEFRPKIDAVPGRETLLRITPTRVGEYKLLCAELCGLGHSGMRASVKVVKEQEFQAWAQELAKEQRR